MPTDNDRVQVLNIGVRLAKEEALARPGNPAYVIREWNSHNFTSFYREAKIYELNLPRVLIVI
jgi:hypothetical protein